jgi:hypothetical protein
MSSERSAKDERRPRLREQYRILTGQATLSDQQVEEMRRNVIRLAQSICEHAWGKRFY